MAAMMLHSLMMEGP